LSVWFSFASSFRTMSQRSGFFGFVGDVTGVVIGGASGIAAGAVGAGAGLVGGTLKGQPFTGLAKGASEWGDAGFEVGENVTHGAVGVVEGAARGVGTVAGGAIGGVGGAAMGLTGGLYNGRPLTGMMMGIEEHSAIGAGLGDDLMKNPHIAAYSSAMMAWQSVEDCASVLSRAPLRISQAFMNSTFLEHCLSKSSSAEDVECAVASAIVYTEPSNRARSCTFGGTTLRLDEKINSTRFALFWASKGSSTPRMILAFKGTSDSADLGPDIMIILGVLQASHDSADAALRSLDFKSSGCETFTEFLKNKHGPGRRLLVTGHSLGGAAAMTVASVGKSATYVDQCYAFNPGTGPVKQNDTDINTPADWINNFEIVRSCNNFRQMKMSETTLRTFLSGEAPDKTERKVQVHHILGDAVSMCTTASWACRVRTWKPRADMWYGSQSGLGFPCHAQSHFLKPSWCKLVQESGDINLA